MFSGAFDCPHCGAPPVRIEARLRAATEVTCERSHRWRPEDRLQIQEHGTVRLKVAGKPFHCECGGNLFRQNVLGLYVCNACGTAYEGTPTKEKP